MLQLLDRRSMDEQIDVGGQDSTIVHHLPDIGDRRQQQVERHQCGSDRNNCITPKIDAAHQPQRAARGNGEKHDDGGRRPQRDAERACIRRNVEDAAQRQISEQNQPETTRSGVELHRLRHPGADTYG
ncbi:MAG: hypothetical protein WDN31_21460 [Hyphomicrobium sp.]